MSALVVALLLLFGGFGRVWEDGSANVQMPDQCVVTVPAFDSPGDHVTRLCPLPDLPARPQHD